jgi:5,10-methylenetetrahydromethanopterin reductase
MRMLHPEGHAAARPVEVPVLIGALGPKGQAVAKELGDGVFTVAGVPAFVREFPWAAHLVWGSVLEEGEDYGSERVRAAAGPGLMQTYHGAYEYGARLTDLPGGSEWLAVVEQAPEDERHLTVHDRHCVALNSADEAAWSAGAGAMLEAFGMTGTAAAVREKVETLAEQGVTELVYQAAGPDPRRELEAFMRAASA